MNLFGHLIDPILIIVGTGGLASARMFRDQPLLEGTSGGRLRYVLSAILLAGVVSASAQREVGTGGGSSNSGKTTPAGSTTAVVLVDEHRVVQVGIQALPSPSSVADQIAMVHEVFGLTMAQTAQVLCVSRPTLYSWLQDPSRVPIASSRERLAQLSAVATSLPSDTQGGISRRYVGVRLSNGHQLLEELKKDPLDVHVLASTAHEAMRLTIADSVGRPGRPQSSVSQTLARWGKRAPGGEAGLAALRTTVDQLRTQS